MIILRAEVEQIPNPSAPSSPQTLLSGLCASAKSNVAPLRLLFAKIFSSKIFLRGIIVFSIFMASGEAFAPFAIITAQAGVLATQGKRRLRSRFLTAMSKTAVHGARTPYHGDAHFAPFTPAPAHPNLPNLWLMGVRRALCAPAWCAVRARRTKKSPFSAAIS